jgi:predicted acetyltransferase
MHIELEPAAPEEKLVLLRLMELYCYDYSEFLTWPLSETALFCNEQRFEERWADTAIDKYFLRVDGHLAGFVMVHHGSRLNEDLDTCDIEEFFVMRGYRRQGVGKTVARRVFDLHHGRWEVRVMTQNENAQAFWRSVLHEYSNGRFDEVTWDNERWCGLVFSFDMAASAAASANTPPGT